MGWLTDIMTNSLIFINSFVGNYGVSIIIFTIIIKLLMYPITAKQTKSMKDMQKIQPELKKVQEEYKDDKEKQQKETMKLYSEHGVNPAASCLPMILTMIIIFPLFRSIQGLDVGETTFLWIQNLGEPDAALVIINALGMAGQTYLQTKLSGTNSGQNSMIMWIMPIMILFMGFTLPAGVLIYWFTQSVLTAVQQYLINKDPQEKGVAKE